MQKLQPNNFLVADMSHYQGDAQFTGFASSGVQAAIFEASQGVSYVDPNFATFTVRARAESVPFSAYHFAEPMHNKPEDELAHFLKQWNGAAIPATVGWLDVEEYCDGMTPDQVADWVLAFEAGFRSATGKILGFYSDLGFILEFKGFNGRLAHMPLWIANYPASGTDLTNFVIQDVGGWQDWVMWQCKNTGIITGVPNRVDLSYARSFEAIGFFPLQKALQLDPKVANYTIHRWIGEDYAYASDDDKRMRMYVADQLRIMSKQEAQNTAALNGWKPNL